VNTANVRWHDEVAAARAAGVPIVAFESSVFAQGLQAPANREAHQRMNRAVRARQAMPAVTGVAAGRALVGLDDTTLERFFAGRARKVSARDLGYAIASGADGATTVAGALAIVAAAGIDVFATGGIGGVHRSGGGGSAFDESADLLELSRTGAIVVCAGAKAILDLPATVERLETLGVAVVGFRTDEFPGFFTARTGLPVPARCDSAAEVARTFAAGRALGRPGALLVVQQPPAGEALDPAVVEAAVARALAGAEAGGVRGAALTPHLLDAVAHATGGRSLRANVALLESNAALAAEVAVALAGESGAR
jgi:pseudouridine-5'-phosphate glycosidase